MRTNPLKEGALTENSAGIGTVTSKMVRQRTVELTAIDGRSSLSASKSECEAGQTGVDG